MNNRLLGWPGPALTGKPAQQRTASDGPARRLVRLEPIAYAVFSGVCTLWVALQFYGALRLQTLYALAWHYPDAYEQLIAGSIQGPWSAPLDDVFIHFDFARSTAQGYPFQWIAGNGYSSGGTSLLYPFVLAVGYVLGFRELNLMAWAAVVACVSVFAILLAARRLFENLPRIASYLAPVAFLSVGGLDWTLFSGMEVALFLALWGGAFGSWHGLQRLLLRATAPPRSEVYLRGAALGLWGLLLVGARPEGAVIVAIFALSTAWRAWPRLPTLSLGALFALMVVPGAALVVGHALANHYLTGNSSAAGALVKLELNDPKLTMTDVWEDWKFYLKYQVLRVTHYHFGKYKALGWLVWVMALIPWFDRRTRGPAAMLWTSAALWVLITATNGQVRWQNERYTMPAVAWFMLAAGLGLGLLLTESLRMDRKWWVRPIPAACGVILAGLYLVSQTPRFWGQVWFFGRASRNIFDQHVRAGLLIGQQLAPTPRRVLVGDAGAIPYVSGLPALDLIGLGGYRQLPFAEAARWSVAAGIELIERMEPELRPDIMAIYPSWWSELPLWFADRTLTRIHARGNTICGAPTKVIYQADWASLNDSHLPFGLQEGWGVRDTLDLGDVISEKDHGLHLSQRGKGHVGHKLLTHPERPRDDLWDAGRMVDGSFSLSFTLGELTPRTPLRLLLRVAPSQPATLRFLDAQGGVHDVRVTPKDAWQHVTLELSAALVERTMDLRLTASSGEAVVYHLWAAQPN